MTTPIAIIAGIGPGTGAAVARRFAQSYPVALLARKPESYEPLVQEINRAGGRAIGISTDVADASSVDHALDSIKRELGDDGGEVRAAAAVFNASGPFARRPFLETTPAQFAASWDVSV